MILVITWIFFILFALVLILLTFSPFYLGKDDKKNTGTFLILASITSVICFILYKDIFNLFYSIFIWKIISILILGSFLISMYKYRNHVKNKIAYSLFIILFLCIPFVLNDNVEDNKIMNVYSFKIDFSQLNTISINFLLSLSTSIILILLVYLIISNKRRTKKIISSINLKNSLYMEQSSFDSPYNKLMLEKLTTELRNIESQLDIQKNSINNISRSILKDGKKNIVFDSTLNNNFGKNDDHILLPEKNMVKQLNHFLQTPFSTLQTKINLLRDYNKDHKLLVGNLNEMADIINICNSILTTYREIDSITLSNNNRNLSLKEMIDAGFKMYQSNYFKTDLRINNNLPDCVENHDTFLLISILLPLIQNAVFAAPNKSNIEILYTDSKIIIKNSCTQLPEDVNLNKSEYSSKPNHKGTGLMIARNLCGDKIKFDIKVDKSKKQVIQTLNLSENE